MKLYNCPRKSKIRITKDESGQVFFFDHIDGAYSYCLDQHGNVVHLSCGIEVELVHELDGETYAGNS